MKKLMALLMASITLSTAGAAIPQATTSADVTYDPILSTKTVDYNAHFVNQSSRNDGIYYYGPYWTRRASKTRDASGKNWGNSFVRITQEQTTKRGTWVKFSHYGKTIGWVDAKAVAPYSRTANANSLLKKYNFRGKALLFNNYEKGASHVNVGYADAEKNILNSSNTLYPIASLQKVMTGALIEQLVAKGKISMSTKLNKYYSSVPHSSNITIRSMLDHTSGIGMGESTPSGKLSSQNAQVNYTLQQLKSTGGSSFNYTNANYTLLAGIASKITGKSYESLVKSNIIKPLGLTNTYFWDDDIPSSKTVANSYGYVNGKNYNLNPVSTNLMSSLLGAGNIYSTPEDYYAIQRGLRNGKITTTKQYYQQMSDYKKNYAGGLYHQRGAIKRVHGALSGANYDTFLYGTEGNKTGVILFANQEATKSSDYVASVMYDLARYYNE